MGDERRQERRCKERREQRQVAGGRRPEHRGAEGTGGRGGDEASGVLHLDQGMTDNVPVGHLSAPLFDDRAHPPSAIHYLSLPEARASIMLPL